MSKFVSSEITYIPSLFALAFPMLFVLFIFFTIVVLWKKYYVVFTTAIPLLIWSLVVFDRYINFTSIFTKENCEGKKQIKVMSFNVRLFDVYNWKNNHVNHQALINFIVDEQPDVACLQEYYYQSDGKYPTTEHLQKGIKPFYIHEYYPVINKKRDHFGIATISKYPILNKGQITFDGTSNVCIYTDILIGIDTIRVFNMHLESVRLGIEDYAFISSIDQTIPDSLEIVKTKNVLKRLVKAFKKRNHQVDIIATEIKKSPYPVILCGDFNDVPASYTYSKISKGLIDTYSGIHFDLGSTFNGSIPFLRIDYILHSINFITCSYKVHRVDLSDHFPVTTTIAIK